MEDEWKTLIAVNDSPASELGFQFYINQLHQPNSNLLLLHIVEPHIISSNQTVLHLPQVRQKAADEEKKKVRDLQDKYEERMRTYGINGRITIAYYSRNPGKVICQTAASERCSMIIIGYSSRPGAKQLGSISKYVFRNAHCPVAIIPSRDLPHCGRRGSVIDLPPDYDTARRFSLAVPMLRWVSDNSIQNANSCPDISELGDDCSGGQRSKPLRKMSAGPTTGLRVVTAQVHETDETKL